MILISLRLENIRSYINETINFPEGSVLLSGDIGSGKSTILLAIEFALFGIMRAELSGSSLLRHGCSKGNVELKFKIDGSEYIIKRTLKKTKDSVGQESGYLISNEKKFEGTPIELKAKILQILGYPEDMITSGRSLIYRFTVYTAQEQMKQILFEDKETRLNTLRKAFGIDKYKTIRENSVLLIRELKRRNSEYLGRLGNFDEQSKLLSEKRCLHNSLLESLMALTSEIEAIKEEVKAEKKKLESCEANLLAYAETKKNIEVKEALADSNETQLKNLVKKIEELDTARLEKRLSEYPHEIEVMPETELQEELEELEKRQAVTIRERSSTTERLRSIDSRIIQLKEAIEKASKKSEEAILLKSRITLEEEKLASKKQYEDMVEEMTAKDKKVHALLERLEEKILQREQSIDFFKANDNCPKCRQKIGEQHRHDLTQEENKELEALSQQQHELRSKQELIDSNIKKLKKNIDSMEKIEQEYRSNKLLIARLESNFDELEKNQAEFSRLTEEKKELCQRSFIDNSEDISKIKKRLSGIRDNNMKAREKKNLLEMIETEKRNLLRLKQEKLKLEDSITLINFELGGLRKSLEGFEEANENFLKQKNALEMVKEKQKKQEIMAASISSEARSLNANILELEKSLADLEKIRTKQEELSKLTEWVDSFFVKLMMTMEKHVMISIHRQFSSILKEWFSLLIDDLEIMLDDEFSVRIVQNGYETDIESLSGGEKTSVALAYRLALNKVINDMIQDIKTKDMIILDEPTDGFSSEQLDKVRDILNELGMKQTIIVSHESKMESYVENVIRIIKTDNVSKIG
jgi:exonuclease SbcC